MIYHVFFDGSCYNEPGRNTAGYAACLTIVSDPISEDEVRHSLKGWFPDGTNNQAEWAGLNAALRIVMEWQEKEPTAEFIVYGDSQLIINQAKGIYRVRNVGLRPYYAEFKILTRAIDMDKVTLKWIRRGFNSVADKISKDVNPYFIKKRANELAKRRSAESI